MVSSTSSASASRSSRSRRILMLLRRRSSRSRLETAAVCSGRSSASAPAWLRSSSRRSCGVRVAPPWKGSTIARAPAAEAQQEMPREVEPLGRPALGPRRVQIEDAERDRQALAAVDHAHQVGVLRVVVGERVAAVAVALPDHRVERRDAPVQRRLPRALRQVGGVAGEQREVVAIALERHARAVERGHQQGRLGDVDRLVRLAAEPAQCGFDLVASAGRRPAHRYPLTVPAVRP